MENDLVFAAHHIRNLRGGSQPILVRANDGLLYVVKFTNNLQGPSLPFNESIGSELYRACGLAVPAWKALLVTDSFLDRNPGCWMQSENGSVRPVAGLCFASLFLGTEGVQLLEILPETRFKRIRNRASFWLAWLIDVCAEHVDNRQAVFVENATGWLDAFFVDQGHLFGGPKADRHLHFRASRYLDPRIYPEISSEELLDIQRVALALDADKLRRQAEALPADWRSAQSLNCLRQCLNRLSNAELLKNVADTLLDDHDRRNGRGRIESAGERKQPVGVLCPGIPVAGSGPRPVASFAGNRACAFV